jgi:homoserine kinase
VTLRALVRVPIAERWLIVSVAATGSGVRVERAGTLAALTAAPEDDRIVVGFRAACTAAGRTAPAALHVRASSQIAVGARQGASAAATLAGVVAANALLGLDLDDVKLGALVAAVDGPSHQLADAVAGHTVVVRSECVDVPDGSPAAATR